MISKPAIRAWFSLARRLARQALARPRRSKSTRAPFGTVWRAVDRPQLRLDGRCDNHLGNPHSARDDKWLMTQINKNHFDFTAIVSINCPRRVQAGDAMLEGQAGSRAHLALETVRDRHDQTGRNEIPGTRRQG